MKLVEAKLLSRTTRDHHIEELGLIYTTKRVWYEVG